MDDRQRTFWKGIRQVLIMALGLIEELLGLERSIIPKHRRK